MREAHSASRPPRETWAHFSVSQLCDLCCPSVHSGKRKMLDEDAIPATVRGTAVHRAIERALRCGQISTDHTEECERALKFGASIGGTAMAIEEPLSTPHQALVGIPDALYRMDDGSVAVVDWKDSSAIATNANAMMCAPFDRLPRCALARHALQVSVYGRLLERFHSSSVSALFVHNVRSGHTYDLPYLRIEADFLIDAAIACVQRRTREFPLCEVEGKTAIHPVQCRDGLVRSRLCALQGDQPYVENTYLRSRAWTELRQAIGWETRVRNCARHPRKHVWRMPIAGVSAPAPWFANWEPHFF